MVFSLLAPFSNWFESRGWIPRPHQLALTAAQLRGEDALLIAPTGGGKTLAGFMASLIELDANPPSRPSLHTLYVSPLKALSADIARNLEAPINEMGLKIRLETRTGDTAAHTRQKQRATPPDILLTTPEQIALLLASDHADAFFGDLKCVIVDEIHALASGKRGDLLSLGLASLKAWSPDLRIVGLSATVAEPQALCDWLGPTTTLIEGAPGAKADVSILENLDGMPWAGHSGEYALDTLYAKIKAHKLSLIFVNTRAQAEATFQRLWMVNEDTLPIGLHHGSLAREQRIKIEAAMAAGQLKAVVCTSTLDLGIDWGNVDLVIQLGAPKGAARLQQRLGRANHRMDSPSKALLIPTNLFEVLECRAAFDAVEAQEMDGAHSFNGAWDVLAQHMMGRACGIGFVADAFFAEIKTALPYHALDRAIFDAILAYVANGGYALRVYDGFSRIREGRDGVWRATTTAHVRQHRMNIGTIIQPEQLPVYLTRFVTPKTGEKRSLRRGSKLGDVEDSFAAALTSGDSFVLGGRVVRIVSVEEDAVLVVPSVDDSPAIPAYGGSRFPLTSFLAARVRGLIEDRAIWPTLPKAVQDLFAAQKRASIIPQANDLLVESFPRGNRHYMVIYAFEGRLTHQTLGFLLTRRLERMGLQPLGFNASEYGMSIWTAQPLDDVDMDGLFTEDLMGDELETWLDECNVMARTFRHCAMISGLIARNMVGGKKTARQVRFSTDLIYDVLRSHEPNHILLQIARKDAVTGELDIGRVGAFLARIKSRIHHQVLRRPSPFSLPILIAMNRERVAGEETEDALIAELGE